MKITKFAHLLLGLVLIASLSAFSLRADDYQPTGYDLVAAVNAYRAANGYYALNYNSLVASAAQTHAEWIVQTGQGGHTGSGGSDETVRVSWTGYGGGASIQCDECWASGRSIEDTVYDAWTDWVHQEVMLNAWGNLYTDAGGGVADRGNGTYVFIYDVCKVIGQESSGEVSGSSGSTTSAQATADLSNYVYGVIRATPLADGAIKHKVLYGQTLSSIAEAYGITIDKLRELNDMGKDYSTIWPDQELLIQTGTGAAATQVTATLGTEASLTPDATEGIQTPTPQQPEVVTAVPLNTPTQAVSAQTGESTHTLGLLLLIACGGGLLVYLILISIKK